MKIVMRSCINIAFYTCINYNQNTCINYANKMQTLNAITNFVQAQDVFFNLKLPNEIENTELAEAVKNHKLSDTELDRLEKILSSSEASTYFFNDPIVQKALLQGFIANTHMDERIVAAMKTCTPGLSSHEQQDLFDNQFSWLLKNPPIASNAKIALRFFTDITPEERSFAQEVCSNPKFIPYHPTKYSNQNLNAQINFRSSDELIFCRHLANVVLDDVDPIRHKISYENFSSESKITQRIKPHIQAKYEYAKSHAQEVHLIQNANWGKFITLQFETMNTQGVPLKKMLVESHDHVMAVWLKIKLKDGKKCYVAHFYDPNSTTTHTRAAAHDLTSVKYWTLGAFLNIKNKQQEKFYYPETQPVSMLYVIPESDRLSSQDYLQDQHTAHNDRKLTSGDFNWDATVIDHLMASGFGGTLREMISQLDTLRRSGVNLLNLLSAKAVNATPGLYMALQEGHADAIRAYGELLKATDISGADLLNLIHAQDENGTPGLYMALQEGHADAIRAYGELLKATDISGADLLNLIRAQDENGTPGLYMALQEGHADAIRAYGELLKGAQIAGLDLLDLFSAKHIDGTPGLYIALQQGHRNAIAAYCNVILTTSTQLDKNQKTLLLTILRDSHSSTIFGKRINDDSYNQLKKGNSEFYRQFKATKNALKV